VEFDKNKQNVQSLLIFGEACDIIVVYETALHLERNKYEKKVS